MLLPFANLLRMILIFNKIIKFGFNGYVIEEIEKIKREG